MVDIVLCSLGIFYTAVDDASAFVWVNELNDVCIEESILVTRFSPSSDVCRQFFLAA